MLSVTQCNLARLIIKSDSSDELINREYSLIDPSDKEAAIAELDSILKEHNAPIDEGHTVLANDFKTISSKYSICPAALFCLYVDGKQD